MDLQGVLIEDQQRDTILYAGNVDVRITDWFFIKKNAELKYVGLENALVKFQRQDSVWRQQFLFDYFTPSSTGKSTNKKAGIAFDLKTMVLKNVTFIQRDEWLGQNMLIHVTGMNLDANDLSLTGNSYDIKSLSLVEPIFKQYTYTGKKPAVAASTEPAVPDTASHKGGWNSSGLQIRIAKLDIQDGTYKSDQQTDRAAYAYFDGQHIDFNHINASINNARFVGDTIYSELKLSARERSGFEVKGMDATLKLTPTGMAFSNMELRTNRSTLRNFFAMSYDDLSDMGDFIHKVRMDATFDGAYIDSDDLGYFAPTMQSWKKKIQIKGKVRGTVDDLVGKELLVQAGSSTVLNGDITMTGLPDINQTFIDFKANEFKTTYRDAAIIVPAIRRVTAPDLAKIQYLSFTGSFTGFIRDFVTFGTIRTNLGIVKSDLNMKLPAGKPPVYSGNISTDNFQLGQFLGNSQLGALSMEGVVKGSGFSENNRSAELKGNIRFVEFNGYKYQNIAIEKGKLDNSQFDGTVSMNDENAQFTLNGLIDFSKTPTFNFVADVQKANLKALNLTRDDLQFNGHFNLNFTGNNIDNFLGDARIADATLNLNGNRLPFDSLILSSAYENDVKTLNVRSNEFEGTITGDFNINELPDAVQLFLNKYYPSYIAAPKRMPTNEQFHFDFTTYLVEDYLKLIDSSLAGFNNSHIEGDLDLQQNKLALTADVPYFRLKGYNFNSAKITANGTLDSLSLTGQASNININDSLSVPLVVFHVNSANDISKVHVETGANQTLEKANLNAVVQTYADGVNIEFDPSDFVINGKKWTIDDNGRLQFRSETPASGELVLREGVQEVRLKTVPSSAGNWNDLLVDLSNVNLGDFSPLFMPNNRLEGSLSGNIKVEDPTNKLHITSENIRTEFLRLDNDSLGEVHASVDYDNVSKQLKINGATANTDNFLGFNANISLGSHDQQLKNLISLQARNFQLSILERFLGDLFSDIQGYMTGQFDIKGPFDSFAVVGKGRLKDAGVRVNFTQCFYKIQDTDIELKQKEINLDGLTLVDPVTGNPIYVEGSIEHNGFKDMFFSINVSTQKKNTRINKPVLLINTSYKDNQQFYGRVIGTGSFTLTGPQSELFMGISAVASDTAASNITIPPSKSKATSGMADFLVERKYGREMADSAFNLNNSNIIYDVDVTANRMVSVKVVLDDVTGDEITGRGSGRLNIHSGTSEPLKIRGRFDIEEGKYDFTFQSFFKKPFELRKGSENYIEWTDDPYKAKIHFDATYKAERVNFAPLVNSLSGLDANLAKARGDVYVVASLTGELFKPVISFKLDFPEGSPALSDPTLAFSLQQLEQNTNELYKQVTYLIVFNSFAPSGGTGGTGDIGDFATNTISGIFLGVINDQINRILGRLLNSDKYSINLNTSLYNRNVLGGNTGSGINLGSNVNFSIARSFFNDRFVITAGGGFDTPLQQGDLQQSIQLLPDVTMEWLINQSGTIRASFFYRENADYLSSTSSGGPGRSRRYGTSLIYKKEFESFFKKNGKGNKKKQLPPTEQPAAPKDPAQATTGEDEKKAATVPPVEGN